MEPIVFFEGGGRYLRHSEWSCVLSDLHIVSLPDLLREKWPCNLPCTL